MSFKLGYSSLRWQTPDLEKMLSEMREAGWEGWEMRQSLDWIGTPKRVREICRRVGIKLAIIVARGISLDQEPIMLEQNKRRIDFAAEVEADGFMFMGGAKPKDRAVNDADIQALVELSDELADYASQYKLDVSYHIHTGTTIDSIEDWKKFMSQIKKCKLCIDVSHSALWGYNPSESIKRYKDRLVYMHLQDYLHPDWVELGEGNILDFPAALKTLEEIGYNRWVITCPGQASNRSDFERMKINREYLRGLGY